MKPTLGQFAGGGAVKIDVPRLLETRMLIQAGSGFGKSWVCRRLLEQTAGQVQQLVIDPEGEFATLREKHDYVIAAPHDGDALAHPRTAQILARRLLETGVSAILDIYDLKAHERHAFVRTFCDALVNAPKALWQPVLVLLDEAHVFCPEGAKAESAGAVIDLATRGRKRGFGVVLATQRLSKLNKDAAAETFNKLIGRCELDVDVKRAAAELGMTPKDALEAFRQFEPGDFFAFGPALSPTVERMRAGGVETTHPKAGQRSLRAPPKPTAAIKAVLPKLADLPKEAAEEARTLEDMRRELTAARRELSLAKRAAPAPAVSQKDLQAAEQRGFTRGAAESQRAIAKQLKALKGDVHQAVEGVFHGVIVQPLDTPVFTPVKTPVLTGAKLPALARPQAPPPPSARPGNGDARISRPQQVILNRLAALEARSVYPPARATLAAFCRVSPSSSGYEKNLSTLKTAGLIDYPQQGFVGFTEEGRSCAASDDDGRPLHEFWLEIVNAPKAKILRALLEHDSLSREDLAAAAEQSDTSSGFEKNLSTLRTIGAIDYPAPGQVALTEYVRP